LEYLDIRSDNSSAIRSDSMFDSETGFNICQNIKIVAPEIPKQEENRITAFSGCKTEVPVLGPIRDCAGFTPNNALSSHLKNTRRPPSLLMQLVPNSRWTLSSEHLTPLGPFALHARTPSLLNLSNLAIDFAVLCGTDDNLKAVIVHSLKWLPLRVGRPAD
jgi:hypothetical protein